MPGERQGHGASAPVVAAAAPFFGAGALALRSHRIVEIKARVAFERAELGVVGEDERGADEGAGPVAAAFGAAGVEEKEVLAGLRVGAVIGVGSVEVADVICGVGEGDGFYRPI